MTQSIIRTPYENRDHWMQKVHRGYGPQCQLQDVDNIDMWIESKSGELVALADFKQDHEIIEFWRLKPLVTLADNSKIPAYVVVGYRNPHIFYHIIPLNDFAKKIPTLDKPRFISEVGYIKFLHYMRKLKVDPEILLNKATTVPKDAPLPNVKGQS